MVHIDNLQIEGSVYDIKMNKHIFDEINFIYFITSYSLLSSYFVNHSFLLSKLLCHHSANAQNICRFTCFCTPILSDQSHYKSCIISYTLIKKC